MNTWKDEVKRVLENLGGEASLKEIYEEFIKTTNKKITKTYTASIRAALERNSSDSEAYEGREDLFYSTGIGNGIWGLRSKKKNNELVRYNKYSREEIHDIFSPNSNFKAGAGHWGISGIIKVPDTEKDYIFLVTYGQKQAEHKFYESINEDGILTWQSQPSQTLNNPQIKNFINHNDVINNIYLFLRTDSKSKYAYLGFLSYVSHDNEREKPVYFKWKILDWNKQECQKALSDLKIVKGYKEEEEIKYNDIKLILEEHEGVVYKKPERRGRRTKEFYTNRNVDFEDERTIKTELGKKGEEAVVKHEKGFLIANGRNDLAENVNRTSETNGNTEKFDVLSYELDGTPKYIEVKTTTGSANNNFHMSEREVEFSHKHANNYYLYRVYNLDTGNMSAQIIKLKGPIDREKLKPTNYVCSVELGK